MKWQRTITASRPRYVGITQVEDDGFDYKTRLSEIDEELEQLNKDAIRISKSFLKTSRDCYEVEQNKYW